MSIRVRFTLHTLSIMLAVLWCAYGVWGIDNEPVTMLPAITPDATSYAQIRTFLNAEDAARLAETGQHTFVYSGGTHTTAAGMTSVAFATIAYSSSGKRINQPAAAINYTTAGCAANDTAWVMVSASSASTLANFTRVSGTDYFVDCLSATRPALPADSVWLMEVTIAASAISVVASLSAASSAVPPSVVGVGCDALADATSTIQAAITALPSTGGIVMLAGRCVVSAEILVARSSITIQGQARMGKVHLTTAFQGAAIVLNANITGSVFKFTSYGGTTSQGNTLRDLAFHGQDRTYGVTTGVVNIHDSDVFEMSNVMFQRILGSAILINRCVQCNFDSIQMLRMGDTGEPCLYATSLIVGERTQSTTFSNMRIESCINTPYVQTGSDTRRLKFVNMGFEASPDIANTENTYMLIDGEGHHFVSIHMNRNRTTGPRIEVDGTEMFFNGILSDGNHGVPGGPVFKLDGNTGNYVNISTFPADATTSFAFSVNSLHNQFSNIKVSKGGGFNIATTGNVITNFIHRDGLAKTLRDTAGDNIFQGLFIYDSTYATDELVSLQGDFSLLSGGVFKSNNLVPVLIKVTAPQVVVSNLILRSAAAAAAIHITGNRCDIIGNHITNIGKHGIWFDNAVPMTVVGNAIRQIGQLATDTYDGIRIESTTNLASPAVIANNTITEAGVILHRYGIFVSNDGAGGTRFSKLVVRNNNAIDGGGINIAAQGNQSIENITRGDSVSLASAATLTLTEESDYFLVTGTTNITAIASSWAGRRIVLEFDAALTITDDNGVLNLAGNFVTTARDTLMLISSGGGWRELQRSIN